LKLIVTGGGTGGHVYPALEVAKLARASGDEVHYLGSLRGQEGKASQGAGIPFTGFPAQPLYSLSSLRGLRSLVALLKSRALAKAALKRLGADAVFSTGGYSAGPVVAAAKSLGIRYYIHEGNSVPGRSNLMFARDAQTFTTLFKNTKKFAPGIDCIRVGQPVRAELRAAIQSRKPEPGFVLCIGGSQGSEFLNGCVPRAFAGDSLSDAKLLLASGPNNFESTSKIVEALNVQDRVTVRPYLQTAEMMDAYCRASVIVARSGSTLAEIAMFGIPSVLVPLPTSAGDHQLHNAEEFAEMNAAILLEQPDATPESLSEAIRGWMESPGRVAGAAKSLQDWDLPNATQAIYGLIVNSGEAS
jgi:UDP-N-acetylglucosamine--N-acetylmuramyl-(pentapeptide) pyrophosphoryl-undecaprenol N-acetylglucosamine transferase